MKNYIRKKEKEIVNIIKEFDFVNSQSKKYLISSVIRYEMKNVHI